MPLNLVQISITSIHKIEIGNKSLSLITTYHQESELNKKIILQFQPREDDEYLPNQTKFMVLSESGEIFLEAQANQNDSLIHLQFNGDTGEKFTIKVKLGDAVFTKTTTV